MFLPILSSSGGVFFTQLLLLRAFRRTMMHPGSTWVLKISTKSPIQGILPPLRDAFLMHILWCFAMFQSSIFQGPQTKKLKLVEIGNASVSQEYNWYTISVALQIHLSSRTTPYNTILVKPGRITKVCDYIIMRYHILYKVYKSVICDTMSFKVCHTIRPKRTNQRHLPQLGDPEPGSWIS